MQQAEDQHGVQADHAIVDQDQPRRRVYFLSGFDPRGASFYYRLFSEQVRQLKRRSGRRLQVGHRRGQQVDRLLSRWQVREDGALGLDFCFLHWDDIARAHWPRSPLRMLAAVLSFAGWYVGQGGVLRIARMSGRVALCGLYPVLFTAGSLIATAAVTAVLLRPLQLLGIGGWLLGAIGALLVLGQLMLAWRLANQVGVVWLFRSIRFTHRLGQARDGDLRGRVAELAERILSLEQQDPADQVWLAGHSSGSFVMTMLAAELRRHGSDQQLAGRLRLLSLGQNLANLAVHGKARGFHADLALLAQEPRLPWLDITSRDDYLCFAAVDPYQSCGVPRQGAGAYPELRLIPLAQRQGLTSLGKLLSHQFDLHFEYLRTAVPERSGGFDLIEELLAP